MRRREALKTMIALSVAANLPLERIHGMEKESTKTEILDTDILVVGGGTAGAVAAIQAGRSGCRTILLENGSQLGGTITTGGVAFPGLFHAWGKQIVKGIGWEIVNEAVALNGDRLPDFTIPFGTAHPKHQVRLNGNLYAMIAEQKCVESHVKIRYYETPTEIRFEKGRWHVHIIGKGTEKEIVCHEIIDCTGNAYMAKLAGCTLLRENEIQPGSLLYEISGYDLEALDRNKIELLFDEAVDRGEISRSDAYNGIWSLLAERRLGSGMHIAKADSSTSELHTTANIEGRGRLLKLIKCIKTLPGCENAFVKQMQPEVAIRETYRIDGLYKITQDDYVRGKIFEDSLSYSYYPIDLHTQSGVKPKHLSDNVVATVPLRALIPKDSHHLIVAGRCVSSDRMANSALRVQASCMGMGQAAACAAAVACKMNCDIKDVPLKLVKAMIREFDGIVPQ